MPQHRALTDEEAAGARRAYAEGWTTRALADAFHVSETAIRRALDREHVTRRPVGYQSRPDVDTDLIVRMRNDGYVWQEIADAVGMSVNGVRGRYLSATTR